MAEIIRKGTKVRLNVGRGTFEGKVLEITGSQAVVEYQHFKGGLFRRTKREIDKLERAA